MRKVIVISTQRNTPTEFQTGASTWGQLKETIGREFGNLNEMKATVKETRNSLDVNEALLPSGDFTLFLTQGKIKAGAVDVAKVLEALREEYSAGVDNVLDRLDEGEFDIRGTSPNAASTGFSRISAEDRAIMESLAKQLAGG